jgi:predicted nucleic acid-binding protein
LLRLMLLGRTTMLASAPQFIEYEAVAMRDEHLKAAGLSRDEVGAVLDALAKVVQRTEIRFFWRPQLRDPDDEMVLEVAINGGAEAIVTFNIRDFAGAMRFGVRPMTPSEALSLI